MAVLEHLQERPPQVLQELAVGHEAAQDALRGALERALDDPAHEEAPVGAYRSAVGRPEEDDALGRGVDAEVLGLVGRSLGVVEGLGSR